MSARRDILPMSLPPRLLTRDMAVAYLSLSAYGFDCLVAEGKLPQPKLVGSRRLWCRLALDRAADSFPDKNGRVDVEERWKCAV